MEDRTSSPDPATEPVDGRRLRREQGRVAVVDALIDLMLLGEISPTAEHIARNADVSVASIHRYFSSLDELRQVGIQRYLERIDHLVAIDAIGEGRLDDRIDRFVSSRLRYLETTAPVARSARRQAATAPELGATLQRVRATLADQVAQHFAAELEDLTATARRERVAVIAVLTSFESWDQMTDQGFGRGAVERAWTTHLRLLLDHG